MKLISVNIEGDKHLDKIVAFLEKEQADVVCLQEIFEKDLKKIKGTLYPHHTFAPMMKINRNNVFLLRGVAILSKIQPISSSYYHYTGPKNYIPVSNSKPNTNNRAVVVTEFFQDGKQFTFATTHFTWSNNGQATKKQHNDLDMLLKTLKKIGECVLCGDFNAPRGGKIYNTLIQRYTDTIPDSIDTTLDPLLHKAGPLNHVVDYVFTTPSYVATNVRVAEGVSDHKAVACTVQKI